jgi:hypothetical protein
MTEEKWRTAKEYAATFAKNHAKWVGAGAVVCYVLHLLFGI